MFVEYVADNPFQSDFYPLSGFMASVAYDTSAYIRFFQVCHIHKRHAPGTEAEQEQVAGKGQGRSVRQDHSVQGGDGLFADCAFRSPLYAGVYIAEGKCLLCQPFSHSLVESCPQDSHVKGQGIAADSAFRKPVAVVFYDSAGDGLYGQVAVAEVL